MPYELHAHGYEGETSFNHDHIHEYSGNTSTNPDYPGHIHYMAGYTTVNEEHVHSYCTPTGPAIYVNGCHFSLLSRYR